MKCSLLQAWLTVETAWIRHHERRQLLSLDDHMLKDIGLSRCDAYQEADKGWR
jgi:uncharacterized protein YjiS (DUF1127 family)